MQIKQTSALTDSLKKAEKLSRNFRRKASIEKIKEKEFKRKARIEKIKEQKIKQKYRIEKKVRIELEKEFKRKVRIEKKVRIEQEKEFKRKASSEKIKEQKVRIEQEKEFKRKARIEKIKRKKERKLANYTRTPVKGKRVISNSPKLLKSIMDEKIMHKAFIRVNKSFFRWAHTNKLQTNFQRVFYNKVKIFLNEHDYTILNFDFMEDYFYGILSRYPSIKNKSIFYSDKGLSIYKQYKLQKDKQDIIYVYYYVILELFTMLKSHRIDLTDIKGIKEILLAGKGNVFDCEYISFHPLVTGKKRKGEEKIIWSAAIAKLINKFPDLEDYIKVL